MQTATEWLVKIYLQTNKIDSFDIEQAKEMEKQQIIDAFWNGDNSDCTSEQNSKEFAEKYYNETYGSKGSDETLKENHIGDINEMVDQVPDVRKMVENTSFNTSSQTEISDEEIREQGIKYDNQTLSETPIAHFMEGAFWYREQLKQRQ